MTPKSSLAVLAAATLFTAHDSVAQILFSDNFDVNSTANWTANASAGSHPVNIFFDYSTVGIPSAPNSGGTTIGARLLANTAATNAVFGGVSISPNGQSFTGDYQLRFDMWLNYNGPLGAGGSGSTQAGGAGIGTAGTIPQWAGGTQDSLWFAATGDGNSVVDYRAYSSAAPTGYADADPVFAATGAGNRNHSHPYYTGFGGESAPAAQLTIFPQQTNTTIVGSQGFEWRDVTITKIGNTVTWALDGLTIATVDLTTVTLGGNNILLNYFDTNGTVSGDPNAGSLLFGLFDNVRVTVVPEPSTLALGVIGAASFLFLRRRKT